MTDCPICYEQYTEDPFERWQQNTQKQYADIFKHFAKDVELEECEKYRRKYEPNYEENSVLAAVRWMFQHANNEHPEPYTEDPYERWQRETKEQYADIFNRIMKRRNEEKLKN
jgi:C-terminal processing protease CtpA/Prc